MLEMIIIYFVIMSFVSVVVTIADKVSAIRRKARISESLLMLLSFLGGALFMYVTMILINHKTKHTKFMIALPLMFTLHIIIALLIYINL